MISRKRLSILVLLLCCSMFGMAQDFMMQGFYWSYPNLIGIRRYAQTLQDKVPDMKEAGFNYLWLPPLSRSANDQASVGYDVYDYYDIGEYGLGATKFGSRNDVRNIVNALKSNGMHAVADVIFNHRAGGKPENNDAVKGWIENYTSSKVNAGDNPFPSDRFWCYILLGDSSHNQGGTYYVKIRSASQHSNFYGKPYTLTMWTTKTPIAIDTTGDSYEYEPNQGGSCGSGPGDTSNYYKLGTRKFANIDNGGCGVDEFRLKLDTSMYNHLGDTLWISLGNTGATNLGDFSDQYINGIYYDSLATDLYSQVQYQTFTDFTQVPSHKGLMDKSNFKPNGAPTQLNGDWDEMLFFYDVDQNVTSTQTVFKDFSNWLFDSVGIEGLRLDAVKNYPYDMVSTVLNDLNTHNHNPGMVVGEFYDYNPSALTGYVDNVNNGLTTAARANINIRLFDFALRGALKSACDQFGYDVRNMFGAGMVNGVGGSNNSAVTFVNNHDFRDPGQPVTNNPELVYAYILTDNFLGVPCVFYNDYFNSNFMRGRIKGLMHANKKYISGSSSVDYLSRFNSPYNQFFTSGFASTTAIYQMHNPANSQEVFVAINFAGDSLDVYQQVSLSNVAAGDTFTDIYGVAKGPLLTTITPNNELHVMIPPRSFAVYVKGNHADSLISLGDTLATVDPHVGVQEISSSQLATVYPNPFSSMIKIEMNGAKDEEVAIEICDISGRKVYSEQTTSMGHKIFVTPDITSSGIYFLKLNTASGSATYKVVKQ